MRTSKWAAVSWTPRDVQTLVPNMSEQDAEEWLFFNERRIQERLVEVGLQTIESLLKLDGIETVKAK